MLIIGIVVVLVVGVFIGYQLNGGSDNFIGDQEHDARLLQEILPLLNEDSNSVTRCEEFRTTDGKDACYSTFVALKVLKGEEIDSEICDKVLNGEIRSICLENSDTLSRTF